MAAKCYFNMIPSSLLLFLSILVHVSGGPLPPRSFDVTKYGAVANGRTDSTRAFVRAWEDACAYNGRSRVRIPEGTYLLGSVSFQGPCKGSMTFLIKGTLRATTDPGKFFTDTWIGFRYLVNLTVKGGGYLDGQGAAAWGYNDCNKNPDCKPLPATLRFDFVRNSKVQYLRSINSKNSHINIFACHNMDISYIRLSAPAHSPNTDGIRIGSSTRINISRAVISTGDDCISMVSGSQNIDISDVSCGPGHGISVGSLGRSHQHEHVTGISVRNCTFIGSDNGVRIKTWAPSLYSLASNITFQDIAMISVHNPIVIDQQYCPLAQCLEGDSAVQIENVIFKNIWGISSTQVAVNLQCSGSLPCKNVKIININLAYKGRGGQAKALCSHVLGSSYGKQIPAGCL
ncbi:UNVERIFIED_CONTAM: Exopolygalacturonase [Sesamum calycinum]|uniref:Exopolygalacturonase n=1 Tax=Sesamum calycinum TaxID=2727403 RepID=A0AAW2Q3R6_9LAMI